MKNIFKEIEDERIRQNEKFGEQNHDPFKWLCILGEEVGEVSRAVCEAHDWKTKSFPVANAEQLKNYRAELIQVAAVAVSMIQCLDRGKW
jgi:NTP pyrophosphatase (non-canonical NTP hydrolase)